MEGHIRTPVLCCKNESKHMIDLNLKNYEVSPIEVWLKFDASCTDSFLGFLIIKQYITM